jgi:methyltransferase
VIAYTLFVLAVGVERLVELGVSKRNLAWAFAHGGREYGRGHYPAMVLLHFSLLVGCVFEVWVFDRPFLPVLGWTMVALVLTTQALRWWCINTLGRRWNTLIVVVPGLPLVNRGPYRWLRHPNYIAVVVEGIALPMVHTAWITAIVFTVLNAFLLRVRIRAEEDALSQALAQEPAAAGSSTSVGISASADAARADR